MALLSVAATALMALLHVYILVLEMFLWTTPRGRKAFKLTADFAEKTKALAANQGLYNGFLAAGLAWGLFHPVPEFATQIRLFFLACIFVAGIYGGFTASTRIFYIQALPAAASIVIVLVGL
jgi:putative membrane protein